MALSQEQFDALVARLETEAARNPRLYRLKLAAFASLGYVYLLGVVALLLATVGALALALVASRGLVLLVKKLAIPILALIGVVVRALWIRIEAPTGRLLAKREYPALFDMIDEVRRVARAPRAHVVLLNDELNAAIVQVPRLGMFGWQSNYLILGLPLMQLLSPAELRAVLAHEFGHLSASHGRFGAWIYRVRAGWARVNEALQQQSRWGSFMLVPFFAWFAPRFAAYSFVQARQQEYEADRVAATSIGAAALGSSLIRVDLKARELSQIYWPAVYAAADRQATPSAAPFSGLARTAQRFLPEARAHLAEALQRQTSTADTHPCLKDRLAALRLPAQVPPPLQQSAAQALLGPSLQALTEHFDAAWRGAVAGWWHERHRYVESARQILRTHRARTPEELTDAELYQYARVVEEFDGLELALPLYAALAERAPSHRQARFDHARLLLERGEQHGLVELEQLMAETPTAIRPGCELIARYLRAHDRESEAQPYIERYLRQQELEQRAQTERDAIRASDTWLPHSLAAESLETLVTSLASHDSVKSAYLVRKQLPDGERPLHVVGVVRKRNPFKLQSSTADRDLVQALANTARIPEDILFLTLNRSNGSFRKRFGKVAGARILG